MTNKITQTTTNMYRSSKFDDIQQGVRLCYRVALTEVGGDQNKRSASEMQDAVANYTVSKRLLMLQAWVVCYS